jgi:hypothetical protein
MKHTIIYSFKLQSMLTVPRMQKHMVLSSFQMELFIYKTEKYLMVYTTGKGEKHFRRGHKAIKAADIDKVAIFDKSEMKIALDYFLTATL